MKIAIVSFPDEVKGSLDKLVMLGFLGRIVL